MADKCEVTIRETKTTTTTRQNNVSGRITVMLTTSKTYIRTRTTLLKISQVVCGIICFMMLFIYDHQLESAFMVSVHEVNFLRLVSFCFWFITFLMIFTSILSFQTASLLPKTSFDFIFHIFATILYFDGGISILISMSKFASILPRFIVAAVFAIICAILHAIHGYMSFRIWKCDSALS